MRKVLTMGGRGASSGRGYSTHKKIDNLEGVNFFGKKVESSPENPSRLAKNPIAYVGDMHAKQIMEKYRAVKDGEHQRKLETVDISKLRTTQSGLYRQNLHDILSSGKSVFQSPTGGVDHVELFEDGGKFYIIDGNHRCAIKKLKGDKEITAMVTRARR